MWTVWFLQNLYSRVGDFLRLTHSKAKGLKILWISLLFDVHIHPLLIQKVICDTFSLWQKKNYLKVVKLTATSPNSSMLLFAYATLKKNIKRLYMLLLPCWRTSWRIKLWTICDHRRWDRRLACPEVSGKFGTEFRDAITSTLLFPSDMLSAGSLTLHSFVCFLYVLEPLWPLFSMQEPWLNKVLAYELA